jgi:hypothetical protein
MTRRLRVRSIDVIVFVDEDIPLHYYTIDLIHLTRDGHAMIAAALLPRVLASVDRQRGAHMSKLEASAKPAPSIQQAH